MTDWKMNNSLNWERQHIAIDRRNRSPANYFLNYNLCVCSLLNIHSSTFNINIIELKLSKSKVLMNTNTTEQSVQLKISFVYQNFSINHECFDNRIRLDRFDMYIEN